MNRLSIRRKINYIKELIEQNNLTTNELSQLTDIGRSTLTNYRSCISNPRSNNLSKLCEIFNVSEDKIINVEDYEKFMEELRVLNNKSKISESEPKDTSIDNNKDETCAVSFNKFYISNIRNYHLRENYIMNNIRLFAHKVFNKLGRVALEPNDDPKLSLCGFLRRGNPKELNKFVNYILKLLS